MSKLLTVGAAILLSTTSAWAQFGYYNDALTFSRTYSGGTARMQAIGGAQVSLGGDINAAYANPAGLGSLRKGGVVFTPSLDFSNTDASYFGNNTSDFKANFNFANLGIAFHIPSDDEQSSFRGLTFAITMTRENNFHNRYYYDGINSADFTEMGKTSIVDSYLDNAWGVNENDLNGSLYDAYYSFLINPETLDDGSTGYYKLIGDEPRQVEKVTSWGSQYEWDFSAGANFKDMLYLGAALGINTIDYTSVKTFTESEYFYDGAIDPAINYHRVRNVLRLDGTGVSGTFGMIVRPVPVVRLGATIKTPTLYSMYEESEEDFIVDWNNNFNFEIDGENVTLNDYEEYYLSEARYNLTTPWTFTTGASVFLGKVGFLSADIEFLDYSQAQVSSRDFNETDDNNVIRDLYQNAINIRVGSEFRIEQFMVRAGYALDGDPYRYSSIDNSIQRISGGVGYRNKDYFVDLSVVHTSWQSQRSPYTIYSFDDPDLDISPVATIDNKNLNFSVTFGLNF